MALVKFKNLPDTSTPLNAENLNNNFEELEEKMKNKIYDTGWITAAEFEGKTTFNNYCYYRKKNGFVTVTARANSITKAGVYVTITSLPQGFRPSVQIPFTCHFVGGEWRNQSAFIETSGNVTVYEITNGSTPSFTITFPVED